MRTRRPRAAPTLRPRFRRAGYCLTHSVPRGEQPQQQPARPKPKTLATYSNLLRRRQTAPLHAPQPSLLWHRTPLLVGRHDRSHDRTAQKQAARLTG